MVVEEGLDKTFSPPGFLSHVTYNPWLIMRLLFLILLCACSVQPKTIVRTLDITVTSEIANNRTERIVNEAEEYLREAGVAIRNNNECDLRGGHRCVSVGLKRKEPWRYVAGYQGYYNPGRNTVLVWAGWNDTYNAKVLAHELGHALGCPHELMGLMHNQIVSSFFIWPLSGLDFATGFSESCERIMKGK